MNFLCTKRREALNEFYFYNPKSLNSLMAQKIKKAHLGNIQNLYFRKVEYQTVPFVHIRSLNRT